MADVVFLAERRALMARRVEALLGADPVITMQPDHGDADICCSVRLRAADDGWWLGVVLDKSLLAERVRMGMKPSFVAYSEGEVPIVSGDCEAKLCGRASDPHGLTERSRASLSKLLENSGLSHPDLVVLAVRLVQVRIDDGEAPVHGALPRT